MNYSKAVIKEKQTNTIKSISDLLDVLNDIAVDDTTGQSDTMILDDGTEVILGIDAKNNKVTTTVTLRKDGLKYTIIEERH